MKTLKNEIIADEIYTENLPDLEIKYRLSYSRADYSERGNKQKITGYFRFKYPRWDLTCEHSWDIGNAHINDSIPKIQIPDDDYYIMRTVKPSMYIIRADEYDTPARLEKNAEAKITIKNNEMIALISYTNIYKTTKLRELLLFEQKQLADQIHSV